MARALMEGTRDHDAVAFVEATERLGASIHAEAGWDATSISLDVPAERLAPALDLVVEAAARPTFPEGEVERLREERLNDILQARADPRRRAEEAFIGAIYAPSSPTTGRRRGRRRRSSASMPRPRGPSSPGASIRRGWPSSSAAT
jgi:predicted Zn-dependent peptidase